jgi:D-arabinose 1-dehydrogenase-like Zn-dependent alcohol dehydrogenase
VPVPVPSSGEVLIHIEAASFCHTDYQVFEGAYKTELPHIGSHEPTGTIVALGANTSGGWNIGDRVGGYLFRKPCGSCADCKWYAASHAGQYSAQYCANKTMTGISGANGGFAEYMISPDSALLRLPDNVSFEQAAPLMCAGATIWNAVIEADIQKGQTIAVVGIGGLGLLGIQFAKALGYRVIAIHHRDATSKIRDIKQELRPDLIIDYTKPDAADQISKYTNGILLDAAVVCTDNILANDWILHQLHPRGTCVVLGLPEQGFTFDAFNLVFREIVVKGSLHSSIERMQEMLEVVSEHGIRSNVDIVLIDDAATLPERVHNHEFVGRAVVKMH